MNERPAPQLPTDDLSVASSVWTTTTITPDALIGFFCPVRPPRVPAVRRRADELEVVTTGDGLSLRVQDYPVSDTAQPRAERAAHDLWSLLSARSDLLTGSQASVAPTVADALVLPQGERWNEAHQTALLGPWSDALWDVGRLPGTALSDLKAEIRALHGSLVPLWRQGTRGGHVLSLDADLGGVSLYDLVATHVDYLAHTAGGVFVDERLNTVLRGLAPAERQTVYAYAATAGATWTDAAFEAGAPAPEAFGERVRRKVKRLAAEHRRRTAQQQFGSQPTRPS